MEWTAPKIGSFPVSPKFLTPILSRLPQNEALNIKNNSQAAETKIYDVAIVGGGPAAVSAAIYCARKKLNTLIVTDTFGGQSLVSADIRNWIGDKHIMGITLAQRLESHIKDYPQEITVKLSDLVIKVETLSQTIDRHRFSDFLLTTKLGQKYTAKTVIFCAGARRRKLGALGEDEFAGKGVAYCSICDAPLFKDKVVAVVGGGNAGLEAVQDLLPYAAEIYLVESSDRLKADQSAIDVVLGNPKIKGIFLNTQIQEIEGENLVSSIKLKDTKTKQEQTLAVSGVFVEIGSIPNSEPVKDLVQVDMFGQIMVEYSHARTSYPGIFAAGDVTQEPFKQNMIAAGDGVRAALSAYDYIMNRSKVFSTAVKP